MRGSAPAIPAAIRSVIGWKMRETCTPKGRCKVGWIVRASGREAWDVWVEISTGLVKLIAQKNA